MDGYQTYVDCLKNSRCELVRAANKPKLALIADALMEKRWLCGESYEEFMNMATAAEQARFLIDRACKYGEQCATVVWQMWWPSESAPMSTAAASTPSTSSGVSAQHSVSSAILNVLEDLSSSEITILKFYMRSGKDFRMSQVEKLKTPCALTTVIQSRFPGVKAISKLVEYLRKMHKNKTANELVQQFQLDDSVSVSAEDNNNDYEDLTSWMETSSTLGPSPTPAAVPSSGTSATHIGHKDGWSSAGSDLSQKNARWAMSYMHKATCAFGQLSKSDASRFCWHLDLSDKAHKKPEALPAMIMKSVKWNTVFAHIILTNTLGKIPRIDLVQKLQEAFDSQ